MVDVQCWVSAGVQKSESVVHIHASTFSYFSHIDHYRVLNSYLLLYKYVCICQVQSPNSSFPPAL